MFKDPKPDQVPNWTCVAQHGDPMFIEMLKGFLASQKIPAQVLSKRDSAYSLNIGLMAQVFLYVPDEFLEKAKRLVEDFINSDHLEEDVDE